jgi:integrase
VVERLVVLPATKHKNKRPKVLPLDGRLWDLIQRRYEKASPDGFLFHRNGKQIKSIRRLCLTIGEIAGLDSAHFFHNLRRSFRTNIGRVGVDDQTGMKLMGHTTPSVYDNYNQISVERLREAVKKVGKHLDNSIRQFYTPTTPAEDLLICRRKV